MLGVDLGDRLAEGIPGVNPKGFFEDADIVGFNDELLRRAGASWLTSGAIDDPSDDERSVEAAAELLRAKFVDQRSFGIKDPRLCRLLPFWLTVFARLNVVHRPVIAMRHPLAAAASLLERDGLALEKGCFLWLEHMAGIIANTGDTRFHVVFFEHLMTDPVPVVVGLKNFVGAAADLEGEAVRSYLSDFLDPALCHYSFVDADSTGTLSAPCLDLCLRLDRILRAERERLNLEGWSPAVLALLAEIRAFLDSHQEVFRILRALENRFDSLAHGLQLPPWRGSSLYMQIFADYGAAGSTVTDYPYADHMTGDRASLPYSPDRTRRLISLRVDPLNQLVVVTDFALLLSGSRSGREDIRVIDFVTNGIRTADGCVYFLTSDPIIFPSLTEEMRIDDFASIEVSFRVVSIGSEALVTAVSGLRERGSTFRLCID